MRWYQEEIKRLQSALNGATMIIVLLVLWVVCLLMSDN